MTLTLSFCHIKKIAATSFALSLSRCAATNEMIFSCLYGSPSISLSACAQHNGVPVLSEKTTVPTHCGKSFDFSGWENAAAPVCSNKCSACVSAAFTTHQFSITKC